MTRFLAFFIGIPLLFAWTLLWLMTVGVYNYIKTVQAWQRTRYAH